MKPIWIVDDDQSIRWVLEKALARENIPHKSFSNPNDVLNALEKDTPQVLISDIRMPRGNGLDLLQHVKASHPNLPVIIMTAYSDLDSAVSSFQGGAFEYLTKPFDVEKAVELIHRAAEQGIRSESGAKEFSGLRQDSADIIGQAPAMQEIFRAIGRLAQSHATVLITGESGAGKELVAHALHKHSPRAKGPFISLSTSAAPKDLLESELFGHERGAFPGAQTLRRGRFEQADGGTLFLGEIGDLPFDLQTRLLRVLTDGHFYRIGGQDPIKANVRIIASTHQNLEQRVVAGLFREDLMHRLNVIRLRMPALRERSEDIPILAKHFMLTCAKSLNVEPKKLSDEVLKEMSNMPFPGNVRQLENLCHWLTVMTPANVIGVSDLLADIVSEATDQLVVLQGESSPSNPVATKSVSGDWESGLGRLAVKMLQDGDKEVYDALCSRFEKAVLQAALEVTRGRRVEAAQRLGIGRNTITRKLQELGIDD
ncbi:nitrogen regulation protein NR(I) [Polynucleobacter sp. QLW-P1DATA-2]|uniref:nitrogen regulation protein NR(I) n=1 Tax=unclassified Polynucleobacter TaxID=2640945 RepID=UPI0008F85CF4|nr:MULTISPECIES: nitrogen regulation protein NR(I) [unclassified Polynucleobacter]OIM98506.1 nitrogen regulation protein NR(I) [Polynucleobacter sp. MWH-Tro8-2-5-gr]OIN00409.1 nitrogen regulation protein NR(I) [Polynucleobacter sp. QLW-P1DATA-2]